MASFNGNTGGGFLSPFGRKQKAQPHETIQGGLGDAGWPF